MKRQINRALISVYDKTGLVEFAQELHAQGVEIVSTGSTAATISKAGIPVLKVEELTGFPESFDGRVKTLHPIIHAGILADLHLPTHVDQLADLKIKPFDLVVVNLYPFVKTVKSGASIDQCIEQIDIGGPSMVRGAAKNHACVAVVVAPNQYPQIVKAIKEGGTDDRLRRQLALVAFRTTAKYDIAVSTWLNAVSSEEVLPEWIGNSYSQSASLRYGENPHQSATLYFDDTNELTGSGVAGAIQLHGKEMSFNNYVDVEAAWRAAFDHTDAAVAIIKHTNPCGIAVGANIESAYLKAHACDPISAFGGVIAANREVNESMAKAVSEVFTEVIAAPSFTEAAISVLSQKPSIRILTIEPSAPLLEVRAILGGALVQQFDRIDADGDRSSNWKLVAGSAATSTQLKDLQFAWKAVRAVKSNAILLASDLAAVGIGMGQVNRVDSARLAVSRAGDRARGSVAASDAFFPFADGLEILLAAGVRAIVQPGGSVRDDEVIAAANKSGVTMYFTGVRHFAHA